ncbi:MAG: adenine phosphoribosyltransferase [SAR324 cluster bacterium]|nr:adenine phosphoribosyltransferase [SAR324 cluster bacterium]MBF0352376.1 adenine phosphoribosyltransferase [SAR324 cluster bacterium]
MEHLKNLVRTIPDFPKPGIQFRDITTLLADPEGFRECVGILTGHYENEKIDVVAGIEARGFILGAPLALNLGTGFIPIRKPGKLPGKTIHVSYELEYGSDSLHMHEGSIKPGDRVLVVDDLLATGGTLEASCKLIEQSGGVVVGCACVIELPELGGRKRLSKYPMFTFISFGGH